MVFGINLNKTSDGMPRSRRKQLVISYIPDYAVLVVMAILWGVLSKVEPFHREFSLTNKTIQYPMKADSVPFYAAVLLCFVFPLAVILAWTGLLRRSFHDMNAGVLGLCLALVLNMMITNTVKNLAGRHRPDFIDRCDIDKAAAPTMEPVIGLLNSTVCRQTDTAILYDGMRSFPSGHTSFSFAGLTYLALWLAGHLNVGDGRGRAYKAFVVMVPELVAMLIGVSRTKDYRHHWQDVLSGAILGVVMGWASYRHYYPSIMTTKMDPTMPYPPRIPEDDIESFAMANFRHVAPPMTQNGGAAQSLAGVRSGSVPSHHHQQQQQQQQKQQAVSANPRPLSGPYDEFSRQSSMSDIHP